MNLHDLPIVSVDIALVFNNEGVGGGQWVYAGSLFLSLKEI